MGVAGERAAAVQSGCAWPVATPLLLALQSRSAMAACESAPRQTLTRRLRRLAASTPTTNNTFFDRSHARFSRATAPAHHLSNHLHRGGSNVTPTSHSSWSAPPRSLLLTHSSSSGRSARARLDHHRGGVFLRSRSRELGGVGERRGIRRAVPSPPSHVFGFGLAPAGYLFAGWRSFRCHPHRRRSNSPRTLPLRRFGKTGCSRGLTPHRAPAPCPLGAAELERLGHSGRFERRRPGRRRGTFW
jgi:hypothetical protein